jgi:hypothetical protein
MTDDAISPLRRRMVEDMTIPKFAPKTQHDYVQRVKNFAAFVGRSPDTATSTLAAGDTFEEVADQRAVKTQIVQAVANAPQIGGEHVGAY